MLNVEKYKYLCTKHIINLSSPCHPHLPVCSLHILLLFPSHFDLSSETRGVTPNPVTNYILYYANRQN